MKLLISLLCVSLIVPCNNLSAMDNSVNDSWSDSESDVESATSMALSSRDPECSVAEDEKLPPLPPSLCVNVKNHVVVLKNKCFSCVKHYPIRFSVAIFLALLAGTGAVLALTGTYNDFND